MKFSLITAFFQEVLHKLREAYFPNVCTVIQIQCSTKAYHFIKTWLERFCILLDCFILERFCILPNYLGLLFERFCILLDWLLGKDFICYWIVFFLLKDIVYYWIVWGFFWKDFVYYWIVGVLKNFVYYWIVFFWRDLYTYV